MKSKFSLKTQLLMLAMGLTLALGSTSWFILNRLMKHEEQMLLQTAKGYNDTVHDAIGAQLYERYGDIQAFAINPNIQSSNAQTIVNTLNDYGRLYGIYDLIMVIDKKGKLIAVNNKAPDGKDIKVDTLYKTNYSDQTWFKETLAGKTTDDAKKNFSGTYIEDINVDPFVSEVYGSKKLGNSFSAQIKDSSGNVIGVISNRAGSRWFEIALKEVYRNLYEYGIKSTEISLYSKNGTLLFEYDPSAAKTQESTYNFDNLMKYNIIEEGGPIGDALKNSKDGSMFAFNKQKNAEMLTGYGMVDGDKFIDSIGWFTTTRTLKEESLAGLISAKRFFYTAFGIMIALSALLGFWFSMKLSGVLSALAGRLSQGANELAEASMDISQSSTEISESSTEQASAIQETAAAIDEVSAMVKKSSENASQSQSVSKQSREAAERGQNAVTEMTQAITDISKSNHEIMTQIEDSNHQISEIVKVISEIGNKTKVINDIVFQTKLLSFNASVEAARAGEHGKGFAVVAEEVGNLAQMSGNAAKEISGMLDSSIQKVESIVSQTQSRVEKLVVEGKEKVEVGTRVAEKCGEALNNILTTVQDVDSMVGEIATASSEQSQGVTEITKAMNQLDQATHQNTMVAQKAASSAEQLNSQSQRLKGMVQDLFEVVTGQRKSTESATQNHANNGDQQKNSKVVSLEKHRNKQANHPSGSFTKMEMENAVKHSTSKSTVTKLASGSPEVPSANDPRFEDV